MRLVARLAVLVALTTAAPSLAATRAHDLDERMRPVLDCGQWGGNCTQCTSCTAASHKHWNLEWWYYAFVPVADAVDTGGLVGAINESIGYIRGITLLPACAHRLPAP